MSIRERAREAIEAYRAWHSIPLSRRNKLAWGSTPHPREARTFLAYHHVLYERGLVFVMALAYVVLGPVIWVLVGAVLGRPWAESLPAGLAGGITLAVLELTWRRWLYRRLAERSREVLGAHDEADAS